MCDGLCDGLCCVTYLLCVMCCQCIMCLVLYVLCVLCCVCIMCVVLCMDCVCCIVLCSPVEASVCDRLRCDVVLSMFYVHVVMYVFCVLHIKHCVEHCLQCCVTESEDQLTTDERRSAKL